MAEDAINTQPLVQSQESQEQQQQQVPAAATEPWGKLMPMIGSLPIFGMYTVVDPVVVIAKDFESL